jgi:hypothetical protein
VQTALPYDNTAETTWQPQEKATTKKQPHRHTMLLTPHLLRAGPAPEPLQACCETLAPAGAQEWSMQSVLSKMLKGWSLLLH